MLSSPKVALSIYRYRKNYRQQHLFFVGMNEDCRKFVRIPDSEARVTCYPIYYLEPHGAFILARSDVKQVLASRRGHNRLRANNFRFLDPATGVIRSCESLPAVDSLFPIRDWSIWLQRFPRRLQPVRGEDPLAWVAAPRNEVVLRQLDFEL